MFHNVRLWNIQNTSEILVTLCLAKPGYEAGEILKTCQLFVYGDRHYLTDSFLKMC